VFFISSTQVLTKAQYVVKHDSFSNIFQICKLHFCIFLKLFQYTNNILTSLVVKIKYKIRTTSTF